jgi:hypothetical protein
VTRKPLPSERRTSSSGFFILGCSAEKLPLETYPLVNFHLVWDQLELWRWQNMGRKWLFRVILPVIGYIDTRLRASRTENGKLPWAWSLVWRVPKPMPFLIFQVPPQSGCPEEFSISILKIT